MNKALKIIQAEVPEMTLSFTLMVQGDDYGLTDALGVSVLKNCVSHGVRVDYVNAMTMEFGTKLASWGDAVIAAAESTIKQMKGVWPSKCDEELYSMLGVTPMIGRNFNGKIFNIEYAKQLVDWAKQKKIGLLAFWSLGRDNGGCPNGGISPDCSSIAQKDLEFTEIFQQYSNTVIPDFHNHDDTRPTRAPVNPVKTTAAPYNPDHRPIDCTKGEEYFPHETDCNKYYWCFQGVPHLELCGPGTVWDPKIHVCNFPEQAKRTDCH